MKAYLERVDNVVELLLVVHAVDVGTGLDVRVVLDPRQPKLL